MVVTPAKVRYLDRQMDSARWAEFEFRDGDIVVSTPAKCGTTWMQYICLLLVFQTPELPRPLDDLSPWLDVFTRPRENVLATLAAQQHRRVIKTHTPLDGIPVDDRATYICVGRDPRDVAISMHAHLTNVDFEQLMKLRAAAMGSETAGRFELPADAETAYTWFWRWADSEDFVTGLSALLGHLSTFRQRSESANVVLVHYQDLKDDLEGQMRSLAARLGITVEEDRWITLVHAATFEQMRKHAGFLVPEKTIWLDRTEFFRAGTGHQWRNLLSRREDLERYRARIEAIADTDLSEWVHRGPIE